MKRESRSKEDFFKYEGSVLRAAITTYGLTTQMIVAMEEMSELTKELSKNLRGEKNAERIAEEIADVEIMLDQLAIIFRCGYDTQIWKRRKIERLAGMVLPGNYEEKENGSGSDKND